MPPKRNEKAPGGKVKPGTAKLVDDKTFGMKNKRGGAAQKQIAQLTSQMKSGGNPEQKRKEAEKLAREREKKAAEEARREQELLTKTVQIQKVPFGVDPKTVVCIFFKKGNCEKGKKCKFSHDLDVERKTEKRNLYTDMRGGEEEEKKKETSADWDEEKLRSVVMSKKGNQRTSTDKVCKFFIEAIEDGKYGWFWICPNGADKCMYKHALPPGYVNSLPDISPCSFPTNKIDSSSRQRNSGPPKRLCWTSPPSRPSPSKSSWNPSATSSSARQRLSHPRRLPNGRRNVSTRRRPRSRPARPRKRLVVPCSRAATGGWRATTKPLPTRTTTTTPTKTPGTWRTYGKRPRLCGKRRRTSGWPTCTVCPLHPTTPVFLQIQTLPRQTHERTPPCALLSGMPSFFPFKRGDVGAHMGHMEPWPSWHYLLLPVLF